MSEAQAHNEETLVEYRMINQLQKLGYDYVYGGELNQERTSTTEVILNKRLTESVKRLNPWISENNLNKVVHNIARMDAASLMEGNQRFHDYLINKLSIVQDIGDGRKNQTVTLIDFDN